MPDKKDTLLSAISPKAAIALLAGTFLTCPSYATELSQEKLPSVEVNFDALEKLRQDEVVSAPEGSTVVVQDVPAALPEVKEGPLVAKPEKKPQIKVTAPVPVATEAPQVAAPIKPEPQPKVVIAKPEPKIKAPEVAEQERVVSELKAAVEKEIEATKKSQIIDVDDELVVISEPVVQPKPVVEKLKDIVEFVELEDEPEVIAVAPLEDGEEVRLPMVVKEAASEEEVQEAKEIIVQKHQDKRTLFSVFKKLPFLSDSDEDVQSDVDNSLAKAEEEGVEAVEQISSLPEADKQTPDVEELVKAEEELIYIKPANDLEISKPAMVKDLVIAPVDESEVLPWLAEPEGGAPEGGVDAELSSLDDEQQVDESIEQKKWFSSLKSLFNPAKEKETVQANEDDDAAELDELAEGDVIDISTDEASRQAKADIPDGVQVILPNEVSEDEDFFAPLPMRKPEEVIQKTEAIKEEAQRAAEKRAAEREKAEKLEQLAKETTAPTPLTEEELAEIKELEMVKVVDGAVTVSEPVAQQANEILKTASKAKDEVEKAVESAASAVSISTEKKSAGVAQVEQKVSALEGEILNVQSVIGGPVRQGVKVRDEVQPQAVALLDEAKKQDDSNAPLRIIPNDVNGDLPAEIAVVEDVQRPEIIEEIKETEKVVAVAVQDELQQKAVAPKVNVETKRDEPKKTIQGKLEGGVLLSIDFDRDQTGISDFDKDRLAELVQRIMEDESQRVKVVSYAKGIEAQASSARRISLQRAIAIRSHMIKSGLESIRINVQAVGDKADGDKSINSSYIYLLDDQSS